LAPTATARQRFQVTTDGFPAYRSAISNTLHDRADFAMLIKVYRAASEGEGRYSPAEVQSTEVVPVMGQPDPDRICTSIVERQNLTIRMQMRRLTRLTNCFSKKWDNLWSAYCLHFAITTSAGFTRACALLLRWNPRSRITCGIWRNCWPDIIRSMRPAALFVLAGLSVWAQDARYSARDWTPSKIVGITEYPRVARIARVTGSVAVQCTLDPAGKVTSAEVLSGPPMLRKPATENALQWTFRLVTKDAFIHSLILIYVFVLEGEQQVQANTTFTFEGPSTVRVTAAPPLPLIE